MDLNKFVRKCQQNTTGSIFDDVSPIKILRVTGCKQIDDALELMLSPDFREPFIRDKFCFVVVVEGDLKTMKELEVFEEAFDTQKPIIISFESDNNSDINMIYYKEANEKNFKKISCDHQKYWHQETLEDGLNVSFDLEFLLRALQSGSGGSFNGKLLETALDVQQSSSSI